MGSAHGIETNRNIPGRYCVVRHNVCISDLSRLKFDILPDIH